MSFTFVKCLNNYWVDRHEIWYRLSNPNPNIVKIALSMSPSYISIVALSKLPWPSDQSHGAANMAVDSDMAPGET